MSIECGFPVTIFNKEVWPRPDLNIDFDATDSNISRRTDLRAP